MISALKTVFTKKSCRNTTQLPAVIAHYLLIPSLFDIIAHYLKLEGRLLLDRPTFQAASSWRGMLQNEFNVEHCLEDFPGEKDVTQKRMRELVEEFRRELSSNSLKQYHHLGTLLFHSF